MGRSTRPILLILGVLLLVRLPFLTHPVQGDDFYYLAGAQHAQIDPLHPNHARYVFQGVEVDMRGHPHPPLNAWFLAGVLALRGDIDEVPFHTAYLLFSLIAVWAMWSLAKRFCARPVWATLFLIATPAFVVQGTSLEADLPLLAFWLAAIALWVRAVDQASPHWLVAAALCAALAAMAAYQSVALVPILLYYLWLHRRAWTLAWLAAFSPLFTILLWQAFERATSGAMPVTVLAGYFQTYNLHSLANKLKNAAALITHLSWLVFPALVLPRRRSTILICAGVAVAAALLDAHPLFWASFATGVGVLIANGANLFSTKEDAKFLTGWMFSFFAFALIIFFAGSARYLLPIVAPVAILAVNQFQNHTKLLLAAFLLQLTLSLGLATANFQHWDGYRKFVASLESSFPGKRVWINGEWGLRYYAEAAGALPMVRGQAVRPGDIILSSRLALPVSYTTGGGIQARLAEQNIGAALPFRLIALGSKSAYSSAAAGYRPFDLSVQPIDVVRADQVLERKPALSFVPMHAAAAESQIISGVYQLESNAWRWAGRRAVILLKTPAHPSMLEATFRVVDSAPGRRVSLSLEGALLAEQTYSTGGLYTLRSPAPVSSRNPSVTAIVTIDRSFQPPGDHRDLGFILVSVGFPEAASPPQ
ncbi:MAG: glycosyltransferase family 39 protein [Acidobacteriia bacterium]|nr:glycosyltransferase family 39 protein [Terriglobia bacterium]